MEQEIHIGQILWQMCCPANKYPDGWYARPGCVEYLDEHKFLFGDGTGGSLNSIGKNYFLTREEAIEHHKNMPKEKAVTSAMFSKPKQRIGQPVDDTIHVGGFGVKVFHGLLDTRIDNLLEFEKDDFTGDVWVSLGEIRDQLAKKGIDCFTVYNEDPLHGDIYMYGNYTDGKFYLFGETIGYA